MAVCIDRRNLYYTVLANVLGEIGSPADFKFVEESGWQTSTIYRLGFPDQGNTGFDGTYPPDPLPFSDGGPRDLYVDRVGTTFGTTLIEGNWDSVTNGQDWLSSSPKTFRNSYLYTSKPAYFGTLAWPPIDPQNPVTDDPTIIPAGWRYVNLLQEPETT
jgi:hypothetical protein